MLSMKINNWINWKKYNNLENQYLNPLKKEKNNGNFFSQKSKSKNLYIPDKIGNLNKQNFFIFFKNSQKIK